MSNTTQHPLTVAQMLTRFVQQFPTVQQVNETEIESAFNIGKIFFVSTADPATSVRACIVYRAFTQEFELWTEGGTPPFPRDVMDCLVLTFPNAQYTTRGIGPTLVGYLKGVPIEMLQDVAYELPVRS